MKITAIKTEKVLPGETTLAAFLDRNVKKMSEKSVLAISSKIIALIEKNILPSTLDKETLLQSEADYFLPKKLRLHGSCTITHNAFIGAAGIDESNAAGHFVLLPKDSQKTALVIRKYLEKRFKLKEVGVIITDSHSTPLRRGASGISIGFSGFRPLKDYRGTPDLFGRDLVMEQANIVDALSSASVMVMGEGNEQTPLALIEGLSSVAFHSNSPTKAELKEFLVDIHEDIFTPIFNLRRLKPGGKRGKA